MTPRLFQPARTVLAAILIAAAAAPSAFAQTRVVFGTSGALSDNSLPVAVAIEKGFYEKAGVKAEVVNFKGGAPAIQALVGGAIHFCICAPEHVIRLRNRGVDGIVALPLNERTPYVLVAQGGSAVKSIADLKGKKIGITTAGSLTDNLVRLALQRAGLNPDRDVEIVSIGPSNNQVAALRTNQIAAGMLSGFDALDIESKGLGVVIDWRERDVPALALLARESWVKANREAAEAVARETLRSAHIVLKDPEERLAQIRKLFPEIDPKLLALGSKSLETSLSRHPRFSKEGWETLQRDVLELEKDLKPVAYETGNPALVAD